MTGHSMVKGDPVSSPSRRTSVILSKPKGFKTQGVDTTCGSLPVTGKSDETQWGNRSLSSSLLPRSPSLCLSFKYDERYGLHYCIKQRLGPQDTDGRRLWHSPIGQLDVQSILGSWRCQDWCLWSGVKDGEEDNEWNGPVWPEGLQGPLTVRVRTESRRRQSDLVRWDCRYITGSTRIGLSWTHPGKNWRHKLNQLIN